MFARITASKSVSAAALAVTILTGARVGTIRRMRPEHIEGGTFHAPTGERRLTLRAEQANLGDRTNRKKRWCFRVERDRPVADFGDRQVVNLTDAETFVKGARVMLNNRKKKPIK